ncbi:class I SAM-dependent methyltransferase [Vogesella sp. LIG4]|uniref:class I SAM-dependent methyltransferase n=1 Tax=Vogesella sp. LIG4 TaxID=1192162 RepID=UPI00081F7ECE|nr:class I SAM-dependent methyltransferase [Vogesella sp. LIG4]SCK20438.1 Methylase involved in ubiquinone/menaquinone biosynthesis [Vogesella sp. LIG4]
MSTPAMLTHLLLERLSRAVLPREPEPQALMEDAAQIQAFMQSGQDHGILNYFYLFHAVMSLPVIRPGDVVLDLACGPGNQLLQFARLHPDARFIGLDASAGMLALARDNLARAGLPNVAVQQGDISRLDGLADASIDCVLCTMSLHHLPDGEQLQQTMHQIRRVLRADGGVYLADFGRLKRRATQHFFAHDRIELQSAQFTADFLNSLRAAFSLDELRQAIDLLPQRLPHYQTALAPFMLLFRSAPRRTVDAALAERVRAGYARLSGGEQRDFDNLARWFRLGGLTLPCAMR